jgi:tripartite ATP-independent transporter DctM subunit
MEWYVTLLLLFGLLMGILLTGLPVAFAFTAINVVGLMLVYGSPRALSLLVPSAVDSVANFNLTPLPMFVLMAEILTRSGIASRGIEAVDRFIGAIPGRLSVVSVVGGTFWAAISGSAMASTAMLASTLQTEMEKRGYKPQMSVAPILGAASLDPLIPPSAIAILVAVIANVSVAKLLIAGAVPGFILAGMFVIYFVVRARLQPWLAPAYVAPQSSLAERLDGLKHLVALGSLMFVVLGLIFLGVATPSETAALGAVAAVLMAFAYRRMGWGVLRGSARTTIETTAMVCMIIVGSKAYSQMLAATGASTGWIRWVTSLPLEPLVIVFGFVMIVVLLGCFVDALSIMLITIPLFMPVVERFGYDQLWFALLLLISLELGGITPPFGLQLFVFKAVKPHIPITTIFNSVWPIVIMQILVIVLFLLAPGLTYVLVPASR